MFKMIVVFCQLVVDWSICIEFFYLDCVFYNREVGFLVGDFKSKRFTMQYVEIVKLAKGYGWSW